MNKEMIEEIAKTMIAKFNCYKFLEDDYTVKSHCPYYSELKGMEHMLKIMGIDFYYTYDEDYEEIKSITIDGITVYE